MWGSHKDKGDDYKFSGTALSVRCYEKHPTLKLGKGLLVGGSASSPMVKDADVYVSLQSGSTSGRISDPWDEQKVREVQFSIQDMHAPVNVSRFKKMITWLCNQLQEGATVHVGCVGGHGRTGTVVSAIVAELKEKEDAIQWVRKHYCKKAVESKAQIQFLMKHYGVTEVEPTKTEYKPAESKSWDSGKWTSLGKPKHITGSVASEWRLMSEAAAAEEELPTRRVVPEGVTSRTRSFNPMTSSRSLWKPRGRKV